MMTSLCSDVDGVLPPIFLRYVVWMRISQMNAICKNITGKVKHRKFINSFFTITNDQETDISIKTGQ